MIYWKHSYLSCIWGTGSGVGSLTGVGSLGGGVGGGGVGSLDVKYFHLNASMQDVESEKDLYKTIQHFILIILRWKNRVVDPFSQDQDKNPAFVL